MSLIRANRRMVGIDIGGSKMRAVLWDGKRVLAARQVKTPQNIADFKKEITKLATWRTSAKPMQVGIGAAGIISGTKIVRSPNIKYLRNFDFAKLLRFPTPKLRIGNDAQCFAKAVSSAFAPNSIAGRSNILAVTLGTGIGRGLAKNGIVQKIKAFEYPEKWEKEYQKQRGNPKAVMSEEFANFLAENLMSIIKKYKVEILVFGGGVTNRNGFTKKMRSAFSRLPARQVKKIELSHLGKNAVAIGATI